MQVLLAIDGSPQSLSAARFLASLPFREQPRITVATALVDSQFDLATTKAGVQIREVENGVAHQSFETVKAILEPLTTRVENHVERKHPSQLIIELAQKQDVDLIVLGSVGHSALYRLTLGSTADYVAIHAKCSTLVVRQKRAETEEARQTDKLNILLAYDDSPASKEAFSQLQKFSWNSATTKIHLATMLERPKLLPDDEIYDPELIVQKEDLLKQLSTSDGLSCEVSYSVSETIDITNAICQLVQELDSDLLFVGDRGRSAMSRFFMGSTSRYVAHHVRCPLWIARRKQWH